MTPATVRTKAVLGTLFLAFFMSGVAGTILGPLLPALAGRLQLGDGGAGALFMAQFGGAAAGALICGTLLARFGYRTVICLGYLVMAAGSALLAAPAASIVSLGILLNGVGLGTLIAPSNMLTAELSGEKKASRLNVLNLCWGAGAVAGPVAVAWLRDATGLGGVALFIAVIASVSALALWRTIPATVHHPRADEAKVSGPGKFHWAAAITVFLYVGAETTLAGWLPTMAVRRMGAHSGLESTPMSAFWGALLAGRALAAVLLRRWTFPQLMRISLVACPILSAAVALSGSMASLTLLAAIAGFFYGPVFPNTIATLESGNGANSRRLGPPVFAAGAAGGAVIPWIAGLVSSGSNDVRVILWPVLACLILMWPAWAGVRRQTRLA
jgi:fucose permease